MKTFEFDEDHLREIVDASAIEIAKEIAKDCFIFTDEEYNEICAIAKKCLRKTFGV